MMSNKSMKIAVTLNSFYAAIMPDSKKYLHLNVKFVILQLHNKKRKAQNEEHIKRMLGSKMRSGFPTVKNQQNFLESDKRRRHFG